MTFDDIQTDMVWVKGRNTIRTPSPAFWATASPGMPCLVRVAHTRYGRFARNWFRKGRVTTTGYWNAGHIVSLEDRGWIRVGKITCVEKTT